LSGEGKSSVQNPDCGAGYLCTHLGRTADGEHLLPRARARAGPHRGTG